MLRLPVVVFSKVCDWTFTVPGESVSPAMREKYILWVEFTDYARFSQSFSRILLLKSLVFHTRIAVTRRAFGLALDISAE